MIDSPPVTPSLIQATSFSAPMRQAQPSLSCVCGPRWGEGHWMSLYRRPRPTTRFARPTARAVCPPRNAQGPSAAGNRCFAAAAAISDAADRAGRFSARNAATEISADRLTPIGVMRARGSDDAHGRFSRLAVAELTIGLATMGTTGRDLLVARFKGSFG